MSAVRKPPPPDDEERKQMAREERGCAILLYGLILAVVWAIVSAIYFASHK